MGHKGEECIHMYYCHSAQIRITKKEEIIGKQKKRKMGFNRKDKFQYNNKTTEHCQCLAAISLYHTKPKRTPTNGNGSVMFAHMFCIPLPVLLKAMENGRRLLHKQKTREKTYAARKRGRSRIIYYTLGSWKGHHLQVRANVGCIF